MDHTQLESLAVTWLANALARYELWLAAGELVLTGSVTAAYDARTGDLFRGTFARMGSLSARFVA